MAIQRPLNKLRKDVRAISPLIATLLLIAIAVAASVITYSWVMSMIGAQSQQAQTQVRIDSLDWDVTAGTCEMVVRNTGSVAATIESIGIRANTAGSTFAVDSSADAAKSISTGSTVTSIWSEADQNPALTVDLAVSTSYVIRVTCTTGFYYEMVATTPSS